MYIQRFILSFALFATFGFICVSCQYPYQNPQYPEHQQPPVSEKPPESQHQSQQEPQQHHQQQQGVELVFVVFKSGDRSPKKTEIFPHQPFTDEKDWPLGFGQLTNNGKNEMYNLGKLIRGNYQNYLGNNPAFLAAKSWHHDRNQESAELVAVGAYPPVGEFVWNKECNWQPFAVHMLQHIPEVQLDCGSEYDEMKQLLDANVSRIADNMCKELTGNLGEKSGGQLKLTCDSLAKISNFYKILKQNNLAVPFYVNDIYTELVRFGDIYKEMKAKTKCEQISSARVLFDIKDMIATKDQESQVKIQLYAIPSEKLVTILKIVEDESGREESVSAILIDVLPGENNNKVLQFNVLYEGSPAVTPFKLRGCQNSTFCTLDEFFDLFSDLSISEATAMSGKVIAIIVLGVALIAMIIGMLSWSGFLWRKRSQTKKKEYQEIGGN